MKIIGLPDHMENYSLAYFHYGATCEGITVEAQILNSPKQKPTVGWGENYCPKIIPATIIKKANLLGEEHSFRDWNHEFKARFLECFGLEGWQAFEDCCLIGKGYLQLTYKMHYNLS